MNRPSLIEQYGYHPNYVAAYKTEHIILVGCKLF